MTNTDSCRNCNQHLIGKYCSNCGQPAMVPRVNAHYIMHEITHVLHFEKGILYTVKQLLIRPGKTVREFINENRSRLVKPILFIIITSLVYSILTHFFHIEDGYIEISDTNGSKEAFKKSTLGSIFAWIKDHYGYVNIIMGAFIALWVKIFFKKYKYNFYELLILLCFIMGMSMLILAFFAIIEGLTKFPLQQVSGMIFMAYSCWSIAQFFDGKKVVNYIKSFAAYILGMLTFGIAVVLVSFLYDFIVKL